MNAYDGLRHDLNVLLHKRCDCQECDDQRTMWVMEDINLFYGSKVAADIEAKRKRGIN